MSDLLGAPRFLRDEQLKEPAVAFGIGVDQRRLFGQRRVAFHHGAGHRSEDLAGRLEQPLPRLLRLDRRWITCGVHERFRRFSNGILKRIFDSSTKTHSFVGVASAAVLDQEDPGG